MSELSNSVPGVGRVGCGVCDQGKRGHVLISEHGGAGFSLEGNFPFHTFLAGVGRGRPPPGGLGFVLVGGKVRSRYVLLLLVNRGPVVLAAGDGAVFLEVVIPPSPAGCQVGRHLPLEHLVQALVVNFSEQTASSRGFDRGDHASFAREHLVAITKHVGRCVYSGM